MPQQLPILYSFRRCPYAIRARLGLLISQQTVIHREVLLRDKPVHLLQISPKATVPVLLLPDGTVIEESLDILHWALHIKDPQGWLMMDNQKANDLITINDGDFKQHLDQYKYANRFPEKTQVDYRQAGELFLHTLEIRLSKQPYLMGKAQCLVDAALFPFIRQFAFVDKAWFDQAPYPRLRQWLNNWLISDIFQQTMIKHCPWQAGDQTIFFPTQSKAR